jgi:class 3 adenylate cyclase/predicted ATPase
MFSDLVGSTALSARMDPEDLREVISAYQKCVAETVQRFGGFVAKYMGDGVLVYFGYPQAHEDDAERAVRAGLELIEAVGKLSSVEALQVRTGIGTGLVVVGDLIGSGAAQEQTVVGETPNLAARLQAAAAPNSVVIGPTTRRLLANLFEYRDLGSIDVKGFASPVQAWQVMGASAVESRFEALRTATTPLVGRDEEVDLLLRRWEQAKRGEGTVVLISGEPGIGKSRIAETIVERLGGEPHTRLRYFCSPHHQDSALYPSIAQLERAAGLRREDLAEQRLAKLEAVLAQGTNDLSEAVPLLADLLSIPTGNRYPILNLTPQKRKEKILHAQLAQVEGLAARQPVLMVWEDVHWSDATTRESLDLLIERVPTLRVLVIITFRPELAPTWLGRPHVTMLNLNRLPPRHRAHMIVYVTGGKALPKEVADQIVDRADGVPLFIEELTKSVVESGIVMEAGDHYALTGPTAPLAIPATLHASLLARLDRLAPTREVAQIGAALGRSFSHELISAVAQVPQHKLDDALEQLVRAELIFRRGTPPDAEYTFKHALVQDTAYSTLLRSRRQQLHSHIATTLERRFSDIATSQPEIIAQHYTEAGLAEAAVKWWQKAAERALNGCAYNEAIAHLEKGRGMAVELPDTPASRLLRLQLQTSYGYALLHGRGQTAPQTITAFTHARELAALIDDPAERFSAYYGMWAGSIYRVDLKAMREVAEAFLTEAQRLPGRPETGVAHRVFGLTCFVQGDYPNARLHFEQALKAYVPERDQHLASRFGYDPGVQAMVWLASALWPAGDVDRAANLMETGLNLARQKGHSPTISTALYTACNFAIIRRKADEVARHAEPLMRLAREHGLPLWLARSKFYLGWARWCAGERDREEEMREAFAQLRDMDVRLFEPLLGSVLAEVEAQTGRIEAGMVTLNAQLATIEQTGERWFEAEIWRLSGEFLLRGSPSDATLAESAFTRAMGIARTQQAKTFALRAALSLAKLCRATGRDEAAHEHLMAALVGFGEGSEVPEVAEANRLLVSLPIRTGMD